jgi:hypothetical protein
MDGVIIFFSIMGFALWSWLLYELGYARGQLKGTP